MTTTLNLFENFKTAKMSISSKNYKPGTLSYKSEIRSYPDIAGLTSRPRSLKTNKRSILIYANDPENHDRNIPRIEGSLATVNMMSAYYASQFYSLSNAKDVDPEELLVALAGIIANCGDWENMHPWTKVVNAYKFSGIELKFKYLTPEKVKTLDKDHARLKEFISQWESDRAYLLSKTHTFFIFAMIIILSIFKNINENNYENWFANRIKIFAGTLGDTWILVNVTASEYPLMEQIVTLGRCVAANHQLRKNIYLEILSMSLAKSNFISLAFAEINHMVRSFEINHLILIDKYIFIRAPRVS